MKKSLSKWLRRSFSAVGSMLLASAPPCFADDAVSQYDSFIEWSRHEHAGDVLKSVPVDRVSISQLVCGETDADLNNFVYRPEKTDNHNVKDWLDANFHDKTFIVLGDGNHNSQDIGYILRHVIDYLFVGRDNKAAFFNEIHNVQPNLSLSHLTMQNLHGPSFQPGDRFPRSAYECLDCGGYRQDQSIYGVPGYYYESPAPGLDIFFPDLAQGSPFFDVGRDLGWSRQDVQHVARLVSGYFDRDRVSQAYNSEAYRDYAELARTRQTGWKEAASLTKEKFSLEKFGLAAYLANLSLSSEYLEQAYFIDRYLHWLDNLPQYSDFIYQYYDRFSDNVSLLKAAHTYLAYRGGAHSQTYITDKDDQVKRRAQDVNIWYRLSQDHVPARTMAWIVRAGRYKIAMAVYGDLHTREKAEGSLVEELKVRLPDWDIAVLHLHGRDSDVVDTSCVASRIGVSVTPDSYGRFRAAIEPGRIPKPFPLYRNEWTPERERERLEGVITQRSDRIGALKKESTWQYQHMRDEIEQYRAMKEWESLLKDRRHPVARKGQIKPRRSGARTGRKADKASKARL